MTRVLSKGDGISKSVMLAAGEDLLVALSRTTSSGVALSQPRIVLDRVVEQVEQALLVRSKKALDQHTCEVCPNTPVALCYSGVSATSSDERSQEGRGEYNGIFRCKFV